LSKFRALAASVFRLLLTAAFVFAFAYGVAYLHNGWQLVWRKQVIGRPTQAYVPPIDPALARDPDIQAAKLKVIGPLAAKLQAPEEQPDSNSAEAGEPTQASDTATPVPATPSGADLVGRVKRLPPLHIFRGRLTVQGYRDLPFDVPPHASFPRLSGTYKQLRNTQSRKAGLLVLSDQQFRDFMHGDSGEAVFTSDGPSGIIEIALSSTRTDSQKYHLVIRNSASVSVPVDADFTLTFE
jgi:hypothetical protein